MSFPIDEKYIHETETELGFEFPDKFKQKMIIDNGGEILTDEDDWQIYPFFDKSDNKRISKTCNHIGLETKQAKEWDSFPENAIAIATNGCGDYLILLPLDMDNNKLGDEIYFWFHETGEISKIAESIDELINK